MTNISYVDFKLDILDNFFLRLVDKPKEGLRYDEVLDYVSYDFESGFSEIECFVVDFVLYVLCSNLEVARELSQILRSKLLRVINAGNFKDLVRQVSYEERENFLHDIYLVDLITKNERDSLVSSLH